MPGLGPWTILGVVAHLSSLLSHAVAERRLSVNPAIGLGLPRVDPRPVFYWTRDEARKLIAQLDGELALMVDLDLHTGLRIGEVLGLRREFVDTHRWLIHVVGVQTRSGWREYPKSRRSRRPVPVPVHLRDRLADHMRDMQPGDYLFTTPSGLPWDDRNYAERVFDPAVVEAGIRRGTPHDMRHTSASWLAQAGVDLYRIQTLLGHESHSTTMRYAHLAPDAFQRIQTAWSELDDNPNGETK